MVIDYQCLTVMRYRNNKTRPAPIFRAWEDSPTIGIILAQRQKLVLGLTLVEMVIAMAIMAIIFATIVPQFRAIQNSWDSKQGSAETLQNGRILIDHLNHNLSKAVRITAVSSPSETNGYIEFQDNDAINLRYDIGASNYVEFGPIGSLSDLAGPVSQLQFTCYGTSDLSTPITDVNAIRSVKVETTLTNPASMGQDMTFATQAHIRTNALPSTPEISKLSEPWLEFDLDMGMEPALAQIDSAHYLCAYRGDRDDGYARILKVNTDNWSVSASDFLEYDAKSGLTPALATIDQTHYLCAFQGNGGLGWVVVLTVDTGTGTITNETPFEFDTEAQLPAFSKIDDTHYLCAYIGPYSDGWVVVLTVDTGSWTISKETAFEYETEESGAPALSKIDDAHYLCAYRGSDLRPWAVVLTVDTGTWTITAETPFEVAPTLYAYEPTWAKIDDTHYLYAFHTNTFYGCAVVLTVNTGDWTITKATADPYYQFSEAAGNLELCQIDGTNFLCAYGGASSDGLATVLTVDTSDWSLSHSAPFTFESGTCTQPALCQINSSHYLCAHGGTLDIGCAGVLEIGTAILP